MVTDRNAIQVKGKELWDSFNTSERTGVKFGMFPFDKMKPAEDAGYPTRELCTAIMNAGNAS